MPMFRVIMLMCGTGGEALKLSIYQILNIPRWNRKIDRLRQKNNFIYTANDEAGVQVFDVNNVLNPIWSTGIDIQGKVTDVWPALDADYLLAISDVEGLLVLDISDPFYIKRVGTPDWCVNTTVKCMLPPMVEN